MQAKEYSPPHDQGISIEAVNLVHIYDASFSLFKQSRSHKAVDNEAIKIFQQRSFLMLEHYNDTIMVLCILKDVPLTIGSCLF